MRRMRHQEFIEYLRNKGIIIDRITRDYVYISDPTIMEDPSSKINFNWYTDFNGEKVTMRQIILKGSKELDLRSKIILIKLIRQNTGMSLADSKHLVETQWRIWKDVCI